MTKQEEQELQDLEERAKKLREKKEKEYEAKVEAYKNRKLTAEEVLKNRQEYIKETAYSIAREAYEAGLNSHNECIDQREYQDIAERRLMQVVEFAEKENYYASYWWTNGQGQTDKSYDNVSKLRRELVAAGREEAKRMREAYNRKYYSPDAVRQREAQRNFDRRWSYSAQDYKDWENSKDSLN
jgi:hypothetical protein